MPFSPRAKQKKVIDYVGGKMGVSAVPGSGKTRTLSYLAAKLVAEGSLRDDQEVLVVTLTNSAADNFSRQVAEFVRERGLLVGVGYRVRTLHGLANDILRERADLVGLGIPFPIIEQSESDRMLDEAVEFWVRRNPRWFMPYVLAGVEDVNSKQAGSWRYLLSTVCRAYVRQAKDLQLSPEELRSRLLRAGQDFVLAGAATEVFAQYQSALIYRSAVDFGDLIRFALDVLTIDGDYLRQVRYRWPFVLEDEAQDSSDLQERLLRLITAEHGNWVRVGDPNQAIYETFTT
ncbi:MAG: UvrD-helicase domain-containing protein, partial [Anaerolineae bacterium]|nr:UvrD-helicase domain-containing protein [Anaerolineae bacterium]